MIVCPACGAATRVHETRDSRGTNHQRRRRICVNTQCNTRISTVEIVVDDTRIAFEDSVIIATADLEFMLRRLASPLVVRYGTQAVVDLIQRQGEVYAEEAADSEVSRSTSVASSRDDGSAR